MKTCRRHHPRFPRLGSCCWNNYHSFPCYCYCLTYVQIPFVAPKSDQQPQQTILELPEPRTVLALAQSTTTSAFPAQSWILVVNHWPKSRLIEISKVDQTRLAFCYCSSCQTPIYPEDPIVGLISILLLRFYLADLFDSFGRCWIGTVHRLIFAIVLVRRFVPTLHLKLARTSPARARSQFIVAGRPVGCWFQWTYTFHHWLI